MITIYTKNNCSYCTKTKQYLDHFKIPYETKNLDEDAVAKAFFDCEGHRTVPQIYKDNKLLIEGGYSGLMVADITKLQ